MAPRFASTVRSNRWSRRAALKARSSRSPTSSTTSRARRKFLKSDAAESAQISKMATQLALCYPELGLTLSSAPAASHCSAHRSRVEDRLYQMATAGSHCCREAGGRLTVSGSAAALAETGPTRGPQNVFVNRRIVKDRTIAHAISTPTAWRRIAKRSPECTCSWRCRPIASMSTCIRPRPKCGSAISRWFTRS